MEIRPRRRRSLTHFEDDSLTQFVTFRTADSIPKSRIKNLAAEAQQNADVDTLVRQLDILDEGLGECLLAAPACATIVRDALLHFQDQRYRLDAWVIMPNHVHVLFHPIKGHLMSDIVRSWKMYTARQINGLLGRRGAVWQRDFFDVYVRCEEHFHELIAYIDQNPVKAGLCELAEDWEFSSVHFRR